MFFLSNRRNEEFKKMKNSIYCLVTRPKDSSKDLVNFVRTVGYIPIIEPLLKPHYFNQKDYDVSFNPEDFSGLILTSPYALKNGAITKELIAMFHLPVWCVGKRTADAAHAFGFQNTKNYAVDSKALVDILTDKKK